MGTEERLLLRLAFAVFGLVLVLAYAVSGTHRYGRPIWVAVPIGLLVIVVVYGRLMRRRGVRIPGSGAWDAAIGRVRRLGRASRRALAGLRARRRRGRVRRVELAAAAEDDVFAPEGVRSSAESLFRLVQLARDARDPGRLETLMSPELLAEWEERLADAPRGERLEVVGDVEVEYVGFTAPGDEPGARAVVLIEAELLTGEGLRTLSEFWTLGLNEGLWMVLGIEGRKEGGHHLGEPIGASTASARA